MKFREYCLEADALYLGERPKGEIFKPCIRTIPFSQISGALNRAFGRRQRDFKAAGYLVNDGDHNRSRYLIYSPRERVGNYSKVPLQMEYLSRALGKVFILINDATPQLPMEFHLYLGGMRSRGFGGCHLTLAADHRPGDTITGSLLTRIPIAELTTFAISAVVPRYGYLFLPTPNTLTGVYVKSLFEDSIVQGPSFLLGPINKEV
jgi:hypothetical protein